jgi:hypothetical protein
MVIALLVVVACAGIGFSLAVWVGPKVGVDTRRLVRGGRPPTSMLMLVAMVVIAIFVAWAIARGHVAVGIGLLLAFLLLPEGILVMCKRRSRRRHGDGGDQ